MRVSDFSEVSRLRTRYHSRNTVQTVSMKPRHFQFPDISLHRSLKTDMRLINIWPWRCGKVSLTSHMELSIHSVLCTLILNMEVLIKCQVPILDYQIYFSFMRKIVLFFFDDSSSPFRGPGLLFSSVIVLHSRWDSLDE
jgi:hypothetical protein